MQVHFKLREEGHRQSGKSAENAYYAGRRDFSGIEQFKKNVPGERRLLRPGQSLQEFRFAVRLLRCPPVQASLTLMALTLAAVLSRSHKTRLNIAALSIINTLLCQSICATSEQTVDAAAIRVPYRTSAVLSFKSPEPDDYIAPTATKFLSFFRVTMGFGRLFSNVRDDLREVASVTPAAAPLALRQSEQPIDWKSDLAFFRRELPLRHKNLFFRVPRADFERQLDQLERDAGEYSSVTIALRLQELAASLGDDHTSIDALRLAAEPALPLGIYWFSDGWRILNTTSEFESVLGHKVVALDGVPMSEIENRLARTISPNNPWLVKSRLPQWIVRPEVLRYHGVRTTPLVLTTEDASGVKAETAIAIRSDHRGERVRFIPRKSPLLFASERSILRIVLFDRERIFYLQYNRCDGREVALRRGDKAAAAALPSLEEMFAKAFQELKTATSTDRVDTFVFDVRLNPGGASDFGTRFAQKVGEIGSLRTFVLIGRRTYSAAIINAMDFRRFAGARFVGETSGGTPNHYGETQTFTLPSSGLSVSYSTKYFGQPNQALEPIVPDVEVSMSFEQFAAGIDPAIDLIKSMRGSSY